MHTYTHVHTQHLHLQTHQRQAKKALHGFLLRDVPEPDGNMPKCTEGAQWKHAGGAHLGLSTLLKAVSDGFSPPRSPREA